MSDHETAAPWLLPYPDPTGNIKLGATNFKELADRLTTIFKERFLSIVTHAAAYTAVSGELGVQEKAGETTTLPAATTKDRIVGVWCKATSCKITTSGGAFIIGDFITAASKTATITLLEGQHVILQSAGTNWLIVAGESKREQPYSARSEVPINTVETNPSSVRCAVASIDMQLTPQPSFGITANVFVDGVQMAQFFAGENVGNHGIRVGTSLDLNPGSTWEVVSGGEAGGAKVEGLHVSYKLR